jgi:tRNA-2-methylthio-N6-dimethylallyladenosine synthase
MRPQTYKIITYGCQMNASDSELMAGILEARGLSPVRDEAEADVLLVNTCIVRDSAEQRAQGRIARLKGLKTGRPPDRIIGVCGCMAQRDAEAIFDRFPHVDLVLGTRAIPSLSAMLDHVLNGESRVACVDGIPESVGRMDKSDGSDEPDGSDNLQAPTSSIRNPQSAIRNPQSSALSTQHSTLSSQSSVLSPQSSVLSSQHSHVVPVRRSALRALVPIMMGCNNWCSYCIVPTVRGREESRRAGAILDEIQALVQCGCREVTLVGQNVNSYRDGETDFAGLLERVNAVDGLLRVRYITSHPRDANDRHLDAVAALPKVCDHFHLPAQSGSTPVLARMNRGYTREDYLGLVRRVRERLPEATITTDLIVGFPGETGADYEQTLGLVREVRFDSAFTFLYNVREGTRAAEWEDDVPLTVKKERLARLIEIQERISLEKNQALAGKTLEILVEGPARRAEQKGGCGQCVGRTTGDKCVVYDGLPSDTGRLVRTRIVEGAAHTLFGEKIPRDPPAQ